MIGAAVSSYHLSRIISERRLRDEQTLQVDQPSFRTRISNNLAFLRNGISTFLQAGLKDLLRIDLLQGQFGPFIFSYLIFYTICSFPIPIYTLFLVQTIRVSDGVISLGNSIFYIAMILFSLVLARMSKVLGHHRVLVIAAFLYILYPLIGGLAQDPILFYVASMFGGAAWGLANGALINRLFERTPENDRTACMAFHNLALNLGTLLGVLIGSAMPEWLGLRDALILSGALRLFGGVALVFWG
jgi:SET family sugar efflux transporter-like MFS transporter